MGDPSHDDETLRIVDCADDPAIPPARRRDIAPT
jgi:hypothetical protein